MYKVQCVLRNVEREQWNVLSTNLGYTSTFAWTAQSLHGHNTEFAWKRTFCSVRTCWNQRTYLWLANGKWKNQGEMQKGNFQSSACRLDVEKIIIIGAISIFEIYFEGSTTTSRYPKRNFWNSACRLTVERSIPRSPYSNFDSQEDGVHHNNVQHAGKSRLAKAKFLVLHQKCTNFSLEGFAGQTDELLIWKQKFSVKLSNIALSNHNNFSPLARK